jgi:transcriptional regulator with XRE-family HTH domain
MTQEDMGKEMSRDAPMVSHWERGKSCPSALQIHALACCFGVALDSFFEGVDFDEKDAA